MVGSKVVNGSNERESECARPALSPRRIMGWDPSSLSLNPLDHQSEPAHKKQDHSYKILMNWEIVPLLASKGAIFARNNSRGCASGVSPSGCS